MKKFLAAILCAGLIAVTTAGCGYTDALAGNSSTTQETTVATADEADAEVKADSYKDNLNGLCEYFGAKGYISTKDGKVDESVMTEMDASLIGAKEGKKFSTTYGGNSITIELYEYDTKNLSDKANEIISSVEKNGTFTILELPAVKAYMSDSGKYLMIYTDTSIKDAEPDTTADNYKHREEVINDFKSFKK